MILRWAPALAAPRAIESRRCPSCAVLGFVSDGASQLVELRDRRQGLGADRIAPSWCR